MNKHIFIIEGIDGSGKTTQVELLGKRLAESGKKVKRIKFPDYESDSSALVKMYLKGDFGTHPEDVSAYAASTFYAVDRYSSYKTGWGKDYNEGTVIISDRYVSSNIIHQSSKLKNEEKKDYYNWLFDLEYNKLALPVPTAVFFLDVPPEISIKNVENRYQGDESKKDIHEKDRMYLQTCYDSAINACEDAGFIRIPCVKDGKMKSIEEINNLIFEEVQKLID
ncbi:MAG: deoxynucleoside kinase [Clostridia bacterium]|nr:deoxynucleoside kinase [Clostridia bacterium]